MNTFNPRKAILAGLLGLGTVAGFDTHEVRQLLERVHDAASQLQGVVNHQGANGHRRLSPYTKRRAG